jgi:hypothetical protein
MRTAARMIQFLAISLCFLECGKSAEQPVVTTQPAGLTAESQTAGTSPPATGPVRVSEGNTTSAPASSATLSITAPRDGASVSLSELVRGTTPYSLNHYIIVIPENAVWWVHPAVVTNRTWSGLAQFGEKDVGLNESFLIRCLVTKATLKAGKLELSAIPADAIESEPVKVKRTR